MSWTHEMTQAEIEAYNAAIEKAASIAAPAYSSHRPRQGAWRARRELIAAEIRACKVEIGGA